MAPMMQAAEKLVSQKISGMKASGKETAQNAPAKMAVRWSKTVCARCIISQMVSRLNAMCMLMMTIAEANVPMPKRAKMPAMIVG